MAKERRIAPVEQYIINEVRKIRQQLNITAEELSQNVSPSQDKSLIGNIESSVKAATYTDHNLNIIARIFTEKARNTENSSSKKEYTVYDFYPQDYVDDQPVIKTASKIVMPEGPAAALKKMIQTDFFINAKTIKEITDYANEIQNMNWKSTNFTSTVSYAAEKGELVRIDLQDGGVVYQRTTVQGPDQKSNRT